MVAWSRLLSLFRLSSIRAPMEAVEGAGISEQQLERRLPIIPFSTPC
jgi:hypothetical protein